MLWSKARVSMDSITKMPCDLSFEEACTLLMVYLMIMYVLKEQTIPTLRDCIFIHFDAGGCRIDLCTDLCDGFRSLDGKDINTSRYREMFVSKMSELVGDQGLDVVL